MPSRVDSLLNDTAFVVYYAPTKELFDATQAFYTEIFGFEAIPVDAPAKSDTTEEIVWLSSYATDPGSAAIIELLLDPSQAASTEQIEKTTQNLFSHKYKRDWRTLQSAVCFQTAHLDQVVQELDKSGTEYQIRPSELDPFEVYVVDPLASLVGFSALKNPFGVSARTRFDCPPVPNPTHFSAAEMTAEGTPLVTALSKARETRRRNIAVMTSGGDAPGMNANVRAIVRAAIYKGCRAFCIYEGYSGLVKGGKEFIREMSWHNVRGWLSDGGTNIGTARCAEFREHWGRLAACKNLIDAGIDALIVCGGDGSLTGADLFRAEWPELIKELLTNKEITQKQYDTYKHLNICGTVGSIDNDMSSTDATIGAYSSLARICEAIDYIGATAKSHQRAFVVEVMGRHCGWLALMAGIATAADWIFIPEKPSKRAEWSEHMCEIVSKHRARGKRNTIVIVAEGAIGSDLTPITAEDVKNVLVDKLGLDTRVTILGHVQRGGPAVAYDRSLATLQGVAAVEAVLSGTPDTPSPMIGISENKIVKRPLVEAVKLTKSVAAAIAAKDFNKAISLRDSEFTEHLSNFMAMNSADFREPSLPVEKRKRFAIINIGAPAGGMNAAVYAFATYCMSRGHMPYAIHNGFTGLARHESVRSLNWLDIDGWVSLGGSELGTNRNTPEEADMGLVAYYFDKYQFDGLVIVGGFEAFSALSELEKARTNYPAFRIPMVLIPATISNNVPGTEYSLGSDTCLNALIEYCDSIKQSAAATRKRCFVVECQGGNCGYIGTYCQLNTGAMCSYVPEEDMSLEQLEQDIESLKVSFANDRGKEKTGRLLIKSENASKVFSVDVMSKIINSEAHGRFDSKTAIPGHVQQGGIPSSMDRAKGSRLAIRAVKFLEDNFDKLAASENDLGEYVDSEEASNTACVLGIQASHLRFTSVRKLWDYETEEGKRSRKQIFWDDVRDIADMLAGRVKVSQ